MAAGACAAQGGEALQPRLFSPRRLLMWRSRHGLCALLLLCAISLLSGCATQTRSLLAAPPAGLPARTELSATPFFAQEDYQCGPAALAMLMQAAGQSALPQDLVREVYIPARKGSLQAEMLASARRHGLLGVTLEPGLPALLREVAAGHPVVVLQNLSLPIYPLWHYAVVIGYDLPRGDIVLRSGTTERLVMAMSTFEHTWLRSEAWAMVALKPGLLPRTAREADVAEATLAMEKNIQPDQARLAWDKALAQWPHNLTLQLGAGNAAHAAGDHTLALQVFERATREHPHSVAALNNTASLLAEAGRLDEAEPLARRAVELGGPLAATAQATLSEIEARRRSR
jgi:tetratricopeptide (TPR) repeat protein